jgi:hypothetical protein
MILGEGLDEQRMMVKGAFFSATTFLYIPTLVREFCGARQIATQCSTPAFVISSSVSAINGCQLRMPM